MRQFDSIEQFAAFLGKVQAAMPAAERRGLEAGAKLVQEEIKDSFGHYQDAVNGLPEWAALAERTQTDRVAKGYPADEPLLRTGELRASVQYIVRDGVASIGSDDPVAVYQEFGTPDSAHPIPPRPAIGGGLFRVADKVVDAVMRPIIDALEGKFR